MALGVFLSQTALGATHGTTFLGANKKATNPLSSVFSKTQVQEPSEEKTDLASMSTSDMLNSVYNNKATKNDNKDLKLPSVINYGDGEYSTIGKTYNDVVKEISEETGDSEEKIKEDLLKNYANSSGASLNMEA